MYNSWYPALLVEDLEKTQPYGIQILGYPLCFWRHKQGEVQCVLDICPHRSAPLSVGRVMNGTLECKYHGWQFGPKGNCQHIPSAPEQKLSAIYDAKHLPVKEMYKAVWVWIGDEVSEEVLEKKFPYKLFAFDPKNWAYNFGQRDLLIDHGLMVENLLDPAHLPFTHENTLAKRSDAQKMTMKTVWNTLSANIPPKEGEDELYNILQEMEMPGFKVQAFRPNSKKKPNVGSFTFVAPCLTILTIDLNPAKKTQIIQVNWSVPVTPTKMRFIYWFFRNTATFANALPGFNHAFRWQSEKIIDQDVELLGGQQIRLDQKAKPWNSAVSADTGGVIYRKWRQQEEKKKPWFKSFDKSESLGDIEDLQMGCTARFSEVPSGQFQVRPRMALFSTKAYVYLLLVFAILIFSIYYYFFN